MNKYSIYFWFCKSSSQTELNYWWLYCIRQIMDRRKTIGEINVIKVFHALVPQVIHIHMWLWLCQPKSTSISFKTYHLNFWNASHRSHHQVNFNHSRFVTKIRSQTIILSMLIEMFINLNYYINYPTTLT
jgi:hypothetical protein